MTKQIFRICSKCDFEWHADDGMSCPICAKGKKMTKGDCEAEKKILKARYNPVFSSQRLWVQALAIISLVTFLIIWVVGR